MTNFSRLLYVWDPEVALSLKYWNRTERLGKTVYLAANDTCMLIKALDWKKKKGKRSEQTFHHRAHEKMFKVISY